MARATKKKQANKTEKSNVTMRDVAQSAGVSVGTVSRVMNNNPAVKPHIRSRVEEVAKQLGWQPNSIAASMRTSSTRTIGFIVPDIRNPLFAGIERAAEVILRAHGYTLIVANSNDDSELEKGILNLMLHRRVDGLIYAPSNETDPTILKMVSEAKAPVVLVERSMQIRADSVVSDQCGGLALATEHLISLGHSRIALITGSTRSRPGRERHAGFTMSLQKAGIEPISELLRLEKLTADYAYREVQDLLTLAHPPTAIITGGNLMLAGALRALNLTKKKIPDDVSVIAVGDTDLAALAHPSFTSIRWDLDEMGREAASTLLAKIDNKSNDEASLRQTTIATEIILRHSCGAIP